VNVLCESCGNRWLQTARIAHDRATMHSCALFFGSNIFLWSA